MCEGLEEGEGGCEGCDDMVGKDEQEEGRGEEGRKVRTRTCMRIESNLRLFYQCTCARNKPSDTIESRPSPHHP